MLAFNLTRAAKRARLHLPATSPTATPSPALGGGDMGAGGPATGATVDASDVTNKRAEQLHKGKDISVRRVRHLALAKVPVGLVYVLRLLVVVMDPEAGLKPAVTWLLGEVPDTWAVLLAACVAGFESSKGRGLGGVGFVVWESAVGLCVGMVGGANELGWGVEGRG